MLIRIPKTWKDLVDNKPQHAPSPSRRELLRRGLATGAMSVALPELVVQALASTARAAGCPEPVRNLGAVAQIFSEGGPTMGARFIGDKQAEMMNQAMARNYGIKGTLQKLGPNLVIDKTSPFGFTLLQGPPGYPGGAAAWQTNVLSKLSGGGHLGQFNADDGAGENTGLLGGISPFKSTQMGKDLALNARSARARWADGLPSAEVKGRITPASFASTFSLTPAARGFTSSEAMTSASRAANAIAQALAPVFGTSQRKGADRMMASAGCAFYGNSALADPNYGASLFDPAQLPALASTMTVANLTDQEKAQAAAFFQSAQGVAGSVTMQFGGRDYHGADPGNRIAPADIEEARAIVMFLAACDAAKAPGAMIYLSNGQAIADGTASVQATINGQAATIDAPRAQGDAGGAYNAGLILFYDPKGSPPQAKMTGTINENGNARIDSAVGSSQLAVAGLYLSALKWISGGTVSNAAVAAMQSAGVTNPTGAIVI